MPQVFKKNKLKLFLKPLLISGIFIFLILFFFRGILPLYTFLKINNISTDFFKSLIFNANPPVKSYHDRTNILLLGISGGPRESKNLTDTIMVVSIDFGKKDIALFSIPRDIWVPSLKDRINAAYHYGNEKKGVEGGFIMAKAAVKEVTNQPIHYVVLIDFSGFKKIINALGGLDVEVAETFDDYKYPIEGKENDICSGDITFSCRFEHIRFAKGSLHLDGETALKFVRSRQAAGDEGTDYARARRQQLVISSLTTSIKSQIQNRNFSKLNELYKLMLDTVITDLQWSEQILLAKFFIKKNGNTLRNFPLEALLINPPTWEYNGAWVLIPKSGNFKDLSAYISCSLDKQSCTGY